MVTMTILERHGSRPFTRADLDAMPDDGRRYELIDGALIVTPAPSPRHQMVSGELFTLLRRFCPAHLQVLFAPLDVAMADDTVVEPDLLVAPRDAFSPRDLPQAPLLAVEVLSPSTRRIDLTLKRSRYEEAGSPSYWVVDPLVPELTAWELRDGRYVEVAHVRENGLVELDAPFPVSFDVADLMD